MKKNVVYMMALIGLQAMVTSCGNNNQASEAGKDTLNAPAISSGYDPNFKVDAEAFADIQMLRYQIPGWDELTPKQKEMAYYLYEAALCGRDILYDQKSKYGLTLRKTLEVIYTTYKGDKTTDDWKKFEEYCAQFWFSSGNHHRRPRDLRLHSGNPE